MIRHVSEFLVGLIFGLGLIVSGMTDPSKVLGFFDVTGLWDPSLAFVMGGAVVIGFFAFRLARGMKASLLGRVIMLNDSKPIDLRLVTGSVIFGIGWGLSGFCPGPAIVSLGSGQGAAFLFVAAMALGVGLARRLLRALDA
jgi:uncharacterized membrane protein YedE/YeeE